MPSRRLCLLARCAGPALLGVPAASAAQAAHPRPAPAVRAVPRTGPITLDGRLDEPAWAAAPPAAGFRQREPHEDAPATQPTEVRFLYDDDALYVGARMIDSLGAAGVRAHLARRDQDANDDYFALVLDTYHDHVGRVYLQVNPSGVQTDALGLGPANPDRSWDGVWQVATHIDSLGWTAEIRIPFATLQYPRGAAPVWGVQLWRYVQRLDETSQWAFWTKREAGGPAFYGHLVGLRVPQRRVEGEVRPYASLRWSSGASAAPSCGGAPCRAPGGVQLGADIRARVAGLAIDGTVNPDFGQVEVDPAVLNLTASESYFPEKRPFFLQESGIFDFGTFTCFVCDLYVPASLYYSRRIGRPPTLAPPDGIALPPATPVLAAARVSEQTASGWTIGSVEAVTADVRARMRTSSGAVATVAAEPMTSYASARVKRQLDRGRVTLGAMVTSTDRALGGAADSALAGVLAATARAAGMDADVWSGAHVYHTTVSAVVSTLSGSPAAIGRAERSSVRYLQRPGRRSFGGFFGDRLAPARTALNGFDASARLAREAGAWAWEGATAVISPGFEVNDLGFLGAAGMWWYGLNAQRNFTQPTAAYQSLSITTGAEAARNADGDVVSAEAHALLAYETPSFWSWTVKAAWRPAHYDDRLTRGGPTVRDRAGGLLSARVVSDPRHATGLDAYGGWTWDDRGTRLFMLAPTLTLRPGGWLTAGITPSVQVGTMADQYVARIADTTARAFDGARYVFARIRQRTAAIEVRLGITVSPHLSLDVYAQPFLAAGRYDAYGEFAAPRRVDRLVYGVDRGTVAQGTDAGGARYVEIDPDGSGPAAPFRLPSPDFTRRSFRGNAVLRWEYRPGSTLFAAVTQVREADDALGGLDAARDARTLLTAPPRSVFMLKASYDLGW